MNQTNDQREALHELRQQPNCLQVIEVPDTWVLLWSQSQNALHIERLSDMYRSNAEAFRDDRCMDYVPLHIGTREGVDIAAEAVRPRCRAREQVRAAARDA